MRSRALARTVSAFAALAVLSTTALGDNRLYVPDASLPLGSTAQNLEVRFDSDVDLLGYSVAIDFDPAVLAVTGVSSPFDSETTTFDDGRFDGGRLVWGVILDFFGSGLFIPAGPNQPALRLEVDVVASESTTTALRFRNEPFAPVPETNLLSRPSGSSAPDLLTTDGTVTITCAAPPAPAAPELAAAEGSVIISIPATSTDTITIERSSAGSDWTALVEQSSALATFVDDTVEACTLYEYRLAVSLDGCDSQPGPSSAITTTPCPPGAVTGLAAEVSGTTITLTWDDLADETGYEVERNGTDLFTAGADETIFVDTAVEPDVEHAYRVRGVNEGGPAEWSPTIGVTAARPISPTGLLAEASPGRVRLSWNDASGGTAETRLERRSAGGAFAAIVEVPASTETFVDTTVNDCTVYEYRALAIDAGLEAVAYSNTASTTTLCPPEPPCLDVVATTASRIALEWTSGGEDIILYRVERAIGGGEFELLASTGPDIRSFEDTTVVPGTTYAYLVRAATGTIAVTSQEVVTTPQSLRVTKAKGKLGKNGWTLTISDEFDLGDYRYEGDGRDIRITVEDSIVLFADAAAKVKVKKGLTKSVSLKDSSKSKIKIAFNKSTMKLKLKNLADVSSGGAFDPSDGIVTLRLDLDATTRLEIALDVELDERKGNKLIVAPGQEGEVVPRIRLCPGS